MISTRLARIGQPAILLAVDHQAVLPAAMLAIASTLCVYNYTYIASTRPLVFLLYYYKERVVIIAWVVCLCLGGCFCKLLLFCKTHSMSDQLMYQWE